MPDTKDVQRYGIHPSWNEPLAPVATQLHDLMEQLLDGAHGPYLPAAEHIFATYRIPFPDVRVLIVGQDPYPTPGHAIGLSFAVHPNTQPLPRSLRNIYAELADDLGMQTPTHGNLTPWLEQGVMLLNRSLSVAPHHPGSHSKIGWCTITDLTIQALAQRPEQTLVSILWGRHAQEVLPQLGTQPTITSAHPSPLSARRGFFGSKPFSRTNEILRTHGAPPINWQL